MTERASKVLITVAGIAAKSERSAIMSKVLFWGVALGFAALMGTVFARQSVEKKNDVIARQGRQIREMDAQITDLQNDLFSFGISGRNPDPDCCSHNNLLN